jgi:hypothetical protein
MKTDKLAEITASDNVVTITDTSLQRLLIDFEALQDSIPVSDDEIDKIAEQMLVQYEHAWEELAK